jgi:citrate lyase subunit beta/citryl-CoA lyase
MDIIRSWLIAPANRPKQIAKFAQLNADVSTIDLEDGTPPSDKDAARDALRELVSGLRGSGMTRKIYVRLNDPASGRIQADLKASIEAKADGVVIPKVATPDDVRNVAMEIAEAERWMNRSFGIIAGIESARGVMNVQSIAFGDSHLVGLYFGGEDFATDLWGARRTPESMEVLYARSRVVLAAKGARINAIDQGVLAVHDDAFFKMECEFARNLGYDGKVCLNPRQAELANIYFAPTQEEVDYSARLLAAAELAEHEGRGVIAFEGKMVDGPLIKRAQRVVNVGRQASLLRN